MRAKRFVASSFARTLETVIAIVTGLIMMPLMIRILGEDLYGIWIVIGSIVSSLYLFDIGMASSVTRFVSYALGQNDRKRASQIVSTAFAIYSVLAIVIFLTSVVIAFASSLIVKNPENIELVRILIVIVGLNIAIEFPFKSYAGIAGYHLRQDLMSYSRIAFKILSTLVVAYLLFAGYQLIAIALVQFLSSFLSNFVFRYIARYLEPEVSVHFRSVDKGTLKEIFGFSAWTFLMDLARLLKERGDVWLVAAFTSPATLTVYYVGVRLVDYANQLLNKAFGFTLPLYTEAFAQQDDDALKQKVVMFLRLNTIVAGLMLSGGVLFGKDVIRVWMGSKFNAEDAYLVLVILLTGRMIVFITNPFSNVLFAMAKNRYQALVSVIETIASLVLIPIFITFIPNPLLAASLAISLPFTFTRTILQPSYVAQHSHLSLSLLYTTVAKPLVPILTLAVMGYMLNEYMDLQASIPHVLFEIIGFSVIYLGMLWLFVLNDREKQLLWQGFRRLEGNKGT
ncbi:oligosaccharide flippase family protein [Marinobacter mangrovi]|uniref:oligosaccharide flippase family protein n=1 Tax=Marinobacter mangrovi TaxID=2803918 RepID=UPI0019328C6C|nr:oligosaccharide flippase family protein [Marinobacter mangrovi]